MTKHRPTIGQMGQCRKVSFTAFDKSRPPFLPSRSRRDRLSSASTLRRRVLKDRRFHVVFRVFIIIQYRDEGSEGEQVFFDMVLHSTCHALF